MISLNNITLMRGTQTLIRDASVLLSSGQRTGIIGRNGSGKTSLFKALAGEIQLEKGEIELPNGLRTVSMAQETPASEIGRAHVRTPVTSLSRMPSSA